MPLINFREALWWFVFGVVGGSFLWVGQKIIEVQDGYLLILYLLITGWILFYFVVYNAIKRTASYAIAAKAERDAANLFADVPDDHAD